MLFALTLLIIYLNELHLILKEINTISILFGFFFLSCTNVRTTGTIKVGKRIESETEDGTSM